MTPGVDPDWREFNREPTAQEVDSAVGDAHAEISDVVLEGMHTREQHERAARVDLRHKVFSEHSRPDDLGVERLQQVLTLQVGQLSTGTGRRGRHHMVHRAHPVGERGDRSVVGDVHDLCADPGVSEVGVRVGEFGSASSSDDDSRSL
jgi:hypothetical protein